MLQSIKDYINTHEKTIRRVQYLLIGLFIFLIGFDIYLAVTDSVTISNVIKEKTDNGFFILTYFWGAIAANLFISRKKKPLASGTAGSIIVIGIALIIMIFNVESMVSQYFEDHNYQLSQYSLSMALGLLTGILFWRQEHRSDLNKTSPSG